MQERGTGGQRQACKYDTREVSREVLSSDTHQKRCNVVRIPRLATATDVLAVAAAMMPALPVSFRLPHWHCRLPSLRHSNSSSRQAWQCSQLQIDVMKKRKLPEWRTIPLTSLGYRPGALPPAFREAYKCRLTTSRVQYNYYYFRSMAKIRAVDKARFGELPAQYFLLPLQDGINERSSIAGNETDVLTR